MKRLIGLVLIEIIFIGLVFFGIFYFIDILVEYFLSAIEVNTIIVVTFVFFIFVLLFSLLRESITIFSFNRLSVGKQSQFLTWSASHLLSLVEAFKNKTIISQDKLDESADYAFGRSDNILNSLPPVMITLGLLGTFIGLSATIAEVAILMSSLGDSGDATQKVELLFAGLPKAIEGMKLAFHTSLYGLGTSLVSSVAMIIYQHIQDHIRAYLREVAEKYKLLEKNGQQSLENELLQTAKILNEQTSIFGNAIKLASVSLTDQGKHNQKYLEDLISHTDHLNQSVMGIAENIADQTGVNNRLETVSEQLSILNTATSHGFSGLSKSIDSMANALKSSLINIQGRHQELADQQGSQQQQQGIVFKQLEKISDLLVGVQDRFDRQLSQDTIKEQGQYELFKEEIGSIAEQVKVIDFYIRSLEDNQKIKSTPFGYLKKSKSSFFGLFKKN